MKDDDNDSWMHLIVIGLVMVITPVVQLIKAGVKTDADLYKWIMEMPIGYHQLIRFSIMGGFGLIMLGGAWYYIGRV